MDTISANHRAALTSVLVCYMPFLRRRKGVAAANKAIVVVGDKQWMLRLTGLSVGQCAVVRRAIHRITRDSAAVAGFVRDVATALQEGYAETPMAAVVVETEVHAAVPAALIDRSEVSELVRKCVSSTVRNIRGDSNDPIPGVVATVLQMFKFHRFQVLAGPIALRVPHLPRDAETRQMDFFTHAMPQLRQVLGRLSDSVKELIWKFLRPTNPKYEEPDYTRKKGKRAEEIARVILQRAEGHT
jgi:hypothetical protein